MKILQSPTSFHVSELLSNGHGSEWQWAMGKPHRFVTFSAWFCDIFSTTLVEQERTSRKTEWASRKSNQGAGFSILSSTDGNAHITSSQWLAPVRSPMSVVSLFHPLTSHTDKCQDLISCTVLSSLHISFSMSLLKENILGNNYLSYRVKLFGPINPLSFIRLWSWPTTVPQFPHVYIA